MAGHLADLRGRYTHRFRDSRFLERFPYAPPTLANGMILFVASSMAFLFLEETSKVVERRHDPGLAPAQKIESLLPIGSFISPEYGLVDNTNNRSEVVEGVPLMIEDDTELSPRSASPRPSKAFQLRRLPSASPAGAMPAPAEIAWSLALLGVMGLPTKLLAYPRVTQRLGALRTWRFFLRFFPLVYAVVPHIAVMPSITPPPAGKHGFTVWALIIFSQGLMVGCSTFTALSQLILTNL
ncbi:hypothetical protein QIS74_11078 [Colletotrichum tabaci]|uniref:Uncharacterized protein n=1 Tax=Colletotrichum tabaci TaxID=1209068 RepID=A0AAV9SXE8_9PEZI